MKSENKEQTTVDQEKKKRSPFEKNLIISSILLALVIIFVLSYVMFRPDNTTDVHKMFSTEMIRELTTLECTYHNVAVHKKEGNVIGVGDQYVWFEYDAVVRAGIDMSKVKIEEPTEDGVVKIHLPEAGILGITEKEKTISKPVEELGVFTKLTADEERAIINEATEKLRKDATTREVITQAHASAKEVLEQYVINIGDLVGEKYTVKWVDVPNDSPDIVSTTSTEEIPTETE